MKKVIGVSEFVKRQTPDSKYAHFEGTWEELANIVEKEASWGPNLNIRDGYRKGVLLVHVDPDRFFSSVVELQEGDEFVSVYKARRPGENPYIQSIYKGNKIPAKFVEIVLYESERESPRSLVVG